MSEDSTSTSPPAGAEQSPEHSPGISADPEERGRLWNRVLLHIEQQLGTDRFSMWFNKTELTKLAGSELVVGVPSVLAQQYLEHRYRDTVRQAASALVGRPVKVSFSIEPHLFQQQRAGGKGEGQAPPDPGSSPSSRAGRDATEPEARPSPRHTFERLVVTSPNRLAFEVARQLAMSPVCRFPFVLVIAAPGCGKTALLEAMHESARSGEACGPCEYVMAQSWSNDYYYAVQCGRTRPFRQRYHDCGVLIIDGVEFVQGKPGTQDELCYTVKNLRRAGGRVGMSCSVHPKDLCEVKEAFSTLLDGALWVELVVPQAPECEQLARGMAQGYDLEAEQAVYCHLAERYSSSLRELRGAVSSLAGYADLEGRRTVDLAFARRALAATCRARTREPDLRELCQVVVEMCPVTEQQLKGKLRTRSVTRARHTAMYLASKLTRNSLSDIGRFFGGRTHSTVRHAIDTIQAQRESDEETAALVERCCNKLR